MLTGFKPFVRKVSKKGGKGNKLTQNVFSTGDDGPKFPLNSSPDGELRKSVKEKCNMLFWSIVHVRPIKSGRDSYSCGSLHIP